MANTRLWHVAVYDGMLWHFTACYGTVVPSCGVWHRGESSEILAVAAVGPRCIENYHNGPKPLYE